MEQVNPPAALMPARAANLVLWAIGAFLLLFLLWATFARVDEVTRADGRVIPSRQLQVVQNLEGGIIKEVLVSAGDQVAADQTLLRLDQTQFAAQFLQGQESYNALVARILRLQAEVDETVPRYSDALLRTAGDVVRGELALFSARKADLTARLNVAEARLAQAGRSVSEAQIQATTAQQARALAEQELKLLAPLVERGIEPQIELLRAQGRAAQAAGEANSAGIAVERARGALQEAEFERVSVLQTYRAEAMQALTDAKTELAGMGRELPALEDKVVRTDVRAPIAGTISRVLVSTLGGVVKPGEPLVELVPLDDTLVVEGKVRPQDIAFLAPGQRASIKITAYDFARYGSLQGRIEHISADAADDPQSGESFYTIRVRTNGDSSLKGDDGALLPITPGMVAQIDVLGQKRSVLSYILTPITRVTSTAFRES